MTKPLGGASLVEDLENSLPDGPTGSRCPKCGGLITTEDQHLNCTDEKQSAEEQLKELADDSGSTQGK